MRCRSQRPSRKHNSPTPCQIESWLPSRQREVATAPVRPDGQGQDASRNRSLSFDRVASSPLPATGMQRCVTIRRPPRFVRTDRSRQGRAIRQSAPRSRASSTNSWGSTVSLVRSHGRKRGKQPDNHGPTTSRQPSAGRADAKVGQFRDAPEFRPSRGGREITTVAHAGNRLSMFAPSNVHLSGQHGTIAWPRVRRHVAKTSYHRLWNSPVCGKRRDKSPAVYAVHWLVATRCGG
jgi:hypothetical protein